MTISYDIDGAAKEGVFRLELMTWDMPDWRGTARVERYVTCGNGGTLEVDGLPPGEYDVCRYIEPMVVGDMGHGGMLDRSFAVKIEAGKTAKLEFVRTKGGPISGQVVGLKEAGAPGAFVNVRPEQVTGDPRAPGDEWKLPFFDALATGPDGQFKTSRISPGTYMVTAEAYKPETPEERGRLGLAGCRIFWARSRSSCRKAARSSRSASSLSRSLAKRPPRRPRNPHQPSHPPLTSRRRERRRQRRRFRRNRDGGPVPCCVVAHSGRRITAES